MGKSNFALNFLHSREKHGGEKHSGEKQFCTPTFASGYHDAPAGPNVPSGVHRKVMFVMMVPITIVAKAMTKRTQ